MMEPQGLAAGLNFFAVPEDIFLGRAGLGDGQQLSKITRSRRQTWAHPTGHAGEMHGPEPGLRSLFVSLLEWAANTLSALRGDFWRNISHLT
jgi:hypothetical protein